MVLPDLLPVPDADIVELKRGTRGFRLCDVLLGPLALGRFYFFGFAPGRGLGTPVKAVTTQPEVELPKRRAPILVDGHGTSFRVWLAMKSSRSASANMRRMRFLPWPTLTYRSAPEATWPLSVFTEQWSLRAVSAGVRSPSGGSWRGLRATGGGATCPASRSAPSSIAARPRPRRVAPGCSGTRRLAATA